MQKDIVICSVFLPARVLRIFLCAAISLVIYLMSLKRLNLPDNYIVICAISKNPPKDMPIDTAIDFN